MGAFLDGRTASRTHTGRRRGGGDGVDVGGRIWHRHRHLMPVCRHFHTKPSISSSWLVGLPDQIATGQRLVYICSQSTMMRQDDLITLIRDVNWRIMQLCYTYSSSKPPEHDKKLAKWFGRAPLSPMWLYMPDNRPADCEIPAYTLISMFMFSYSFHPVSLWAPTSLKSVREVWFQSINYKRSFHLF